MTDKIHDRQRQEIAAYREIREHLAEQVRLLREAERRGEGWNQGKADAIYKVEKEIAVMMHDLEHWVHSKR